MSTGLAAALRTGGSLPHLRQGQSLCHLGEIGRSGVRHPLRGSQMAERDVHGEICLGEGLARLARTDEHAECVGTPQERRLGTQYPPTQRGRRRLYSPTYRPGRPWLYEFP